MRIRSTIMMSACALVMLAGCGSTDSAEPSAPSVPPLPVVSSVPTVSSVPRTTTAPPTTTTTAAPAEITVDPDISVDVDRPYVPAPAPLAEPSTPSISFPSCKAAKAAGAGPFYRGGPGYSTKLDRDGDGIACDAN